MYKNPLDNKQNIFLTGPAGTGKTYAINDYINTHPNTLLCASTGTAAVNIGGSTAHRLFSIPVPAYGADIRKITNSQLVVFADIDAVIIDEISMLRNDAFAFAMQVLHKAEKLYHKKIRVIVSGDFSQLPPIVRKDEEKFFTKYGFDKSGFCFTTKEWQNMKFKVVELNEVKRQTDREFIDKLHDLRVGKTEAAQYFNLNFTDREIPKEHDAIYLCGTNREAEFINQTYLDSIDAPLMAYQAVKSGITGKELPCDDIVLLKPGCRVMFTANDSIRDADGEYNADFGDELTGRFTNGMFGTVQNLFADHVEVLTETGRVVDVEKHKWSIYKYAVDKRTGILKKDEIGYVTQIPLKVAAAITIHKSQGKTFSKMILSPTIFAAGQLYVALSRISNPEGLYLTSEIMPEQVKLDPVVQKFYQNGYTFEIPASSLTKQKTLAKKQAAKTKATKKTKKAPAKTGTKKTARKTKSSTKTKPQTKKKTVKTVTQKTSARKGS